MTAAQLKQIHAQLLEGVRKGELQHQCNIAMIFLYLLPIVTTRLYKLQIMRVPSPKEKG